MKIESLSGIDSQQFITHLVRTFGANDRFMLLDGGRNSKTYIFLEPVDTTVVTNENYKDAIGELAFRLKDLNHSPLPEYLPHLVGFFSYEYLHTIESINPTIEDHYSLPLASFTRFRTIVEVIGSEIKIFIDDSNLSPLWSADLRNLQIPEEEENVPRSPLTFEAIDRFTQELCKRYSNFSKERYLTTIEEIKKLIVEGEVYQINLSQQLSIETTKTPAEIYIQLRRASSAPYGAYINLGSGAERKTILSNSPELFFKRDGRALTVCPIKGTAPREDNESLDRESAHQLFYSSKNRAELAMIVDLMRNDLSKVCNPGSVHVDEFPKLFSLPSLHHLCSEIRGTLREETTDLDSINALFPSGSITGTPKIAAMKYISHLERSSRGVYCGAIGFFAKGQSIFSVAIRTGVIQNGVCGFQVGGGITIESDPIEEYRETIVKARAFVAALK